ncbi:MAG TPA: 4-aminobutyrate--2-oxoglutarate transaminase [Acidobacteriaceae bacterium]|jgi:4-aminobutyrate aminotransferase/(S)-3-amino-2-methylpropionate transaminase|nr:4-aminobutyrate--2-oxoglutarate transaminase [Acidobacteriaceae bacterium]
MSNIKLNTEIPGPNSRALNARRSQAIPRGVYASTPLFIRHAEGAYLEDVDGNRLLDLGGGIGCANVGHRSRRVVDAIRAQLDAFLHLCFTVAGYESYVELAEKLNALTPGSFAKKTFLANSGAEAVENAIKIARAHTGRHAILCVEDAFHGRTMLGLALTSKTHPYKEHFGPFLSDVYRIPFGVAANERLGHCGSVTHAEVEALLDHTFRRVVAAEDIAAVIVEPILGEGGFVVPPQGFLTALADICHKHGIVFIADEVQTGFGRTGELFACTHFGLEPDLILTAKSLGGGLPLAAITGRAEIMDAPGPGGLGGTFGGNPASCAAALAVIEEFADGKLLAHARLLGEIFRQQAHAWQRRHPFIADVRGVGAMQAIEFTNSDGSPCAAAAKKLAQHCLRNGVLILTAGTYDNVVRMLMPLSIAEEDFAEALQVVENGLHAVALETGDLASVAR